MILEKIEILVDCATLMDELRSFFRVTSIHGQIFIKLMKFTRMVYLNRRQSKKDESQRIKNRCSRDFNAGIEKRANASAYGLRAFSAMSSLNVLLSRLANRQVVLYQTF